MPNNGLRYLPNPDLIDGGKIDSTLKEQGKAAFMRGGMARRRTPDQWTRFAENTQELIKYAPTEIAKARRLKAYMDGVNEARASP